MSVLKQKLGAMAHAVTGFALFLKGYAKFTDHYAAIGSIIMLSGIVIIAFVIYENVKTIHSKKLVIAVHFFEGLALAFTTYVYFDEGKTYIPYFTMAAAIAFFVVAFILLRKAYAKSFKEQKLEAVPLPEVADMEGK